MNTILFLLLQLLLSGRPTPVSTSSTNEPASTTQVTTSSRGKVVDVDLTF